MGISKGRWTLARVTHDPNMAIIYTLATNRLGTKPITRHVPVPDAAVFAALVQQVPTGSAFIAVLDHDEKNGTSTLVGFETIRD